MLARCLSGLFSLPRTEHDRCFQGQCYADTLAGEETSLQLRCSKKGLTRALNGALHTASHKHAYGLSYPGSVSRGD